VVAFARGESFEDLAPRRHNISGRRVQAKDSYRKDAVKAMNRLVSRFWANPLWWSCRDEG